MMLSQTHLKIEKFNDEDIIHFDEGILGFMDRKDYVLLQDGDTPFIMCLQCATSKHPSFVVVDPFSVVQDYNPLLSSADLDCFHTDSANKLQFLVIAVLTKDPKDTVINLKSPIVIDPKSRKAKQVILENTEYPIRYYLFQRKG